MATKPFILFLLLAIALPTLRRSSAGFFRDPRAIPPAFNATPGAWDGFHNFSGCHAGQRVDGLSKLKSYLHDFGYIPKSPGNFDDDYDESLEAAIRLYQQNFRLNVSGELDDETLGHIVRPRCGVADIINGTNYMANKTTPSSPSFRTVAHYTFFQGKPRWPANKKSLTYAFLPQQQIPDLAKTVFARAFARWANVIPLNFTETENYYEADITIGFYGGDHGDGEPFDGVLGTLAHSFSPTNGRFHLDSAETWVYEGDVTQSSVRTAVDLESVAVHEIGHLLGLGHSADEDAIMYPSIPARTRKVKLATDDIDGIQVLYGSNPNYNASEGQSDNVSDAGEGSVRLLLRWRGTLWGFAVVLWFLIFLI